MLRLPFIQCSHFIRLYYPCIPIGHIPYIITLTNLPLPTLSLKWDGVNILLCCRGIKVTRVNSRLQYEKKVFALSVYTHINVYLGSVLLRLEMSRILHIGNSNLSKTHTFLYLVTKSTSHVVTTYCMHANVSFRHICMYICYVKIPCDNAIMWLLVLTNEL